MLFAVWPSCLQQWAGCLPAERAPAEEQRPGQPGARLLRRLLTSDRRTPEKNMYYLRERWLSLHFTEWITALAQPVKGKPARSLFHLLPVAAPETHATR